MSALPQNSDICPRCKQRVLVRLGVHLSPRQADIFDIVWNSDTRGTTEEVLASIFYPEKSQKHAQNVIKVTINQINAKLVETDYRVIKVRGQDNPYRVLKTDENGKVLPSGGQMREMSEEAIPR